MKCEEIENRILDHQENRWSPAQRGEVEKHLAGCPGCRVFARQLQQLDAALSAGVRVPALSADFDRRLRERIQVAPAVLSEAERAQRKRQLQAEFEAGMARIGRGSLTLGSLLNHLTRPGLATMAGWLIWLITSQLAAHLKAQNLAGLAPTLLPWLAASAVFLAVGLAEAFPRQRKFLGVW
ncbi:MAG TPA: zf-HC2 domain-containing protein [Verrucomicrobiae bacterium]|nr:zf-HC2 domain-containing protein [Verrucomicrobiae bacterium]